LLLVCYEAGVLIFVFGYSLPALLLTSLIALGASPAEDAELDEAAVPETSDCSLSFSSFRCSWWICSLSGKAEGSESEPTLKEVAPVSSGPIRKRFGAVLVF